MNKLPQVLLTITLLFSQPVFSGEGIALDVISATPSLFSSFASTSGYVVKTGTVVAFEFVKSNPQTAAALFLLASGGSYSLWKVYHSVLLRELKAVSDRIGALTVAMNDQFGKLAQVIGQSIADLKSQYLDGKFDNITIQFGTAAKEREVHHEQLQATLEKTNDLVRLTNGSVQENQLKLKELEKGQQENHAQLESVAKALTSQNQELVQHVENVAAVVKNVEQGQREQAQGNVQLLLGQKTIAERLLALEKEQKKTTKCVKGQNEKINEMHAIVVENPILPDAPRTEPQKVSQDSLKERLKELRVQDSVPALRCKLPVMDQAQFQAFATPIITHMVQEQVEQITQRMPVYAPEQHTQTTTGVFSMSRSEAVLAMKEALESQQEDRALNILLSTTDELPALVQEIKSLHVQLGCMQKKMFAMQQMNFQMLHDMFSFANQNHQAALLYAASAKKYQSLWQASVSVESVPLALPASRKQKVTTISLLESRDKEAPILSLRSLAGGE